MRRRPDLIVAISLFIALALIIGCGGGGGGGGSSSGSATGSGSGSGTATGGTTATTGATTSTTGSTTATTGSTTSTTGSTTSTTGSTTSTTGSTTSTTGSTTSTTGSTTSTTGSTTSTTGSTTSTTGSTTTTTGGGGGFQADRIYYVNGLGPSGYQIRSVQPDGSDDQLFLAHPNSIPAAVPNPAGNKYAFFSQNSGNPTKYDLYTNTSVALAGATKLTSLNLIYTGTLQFSPDGSQIVFTGTSTEGDFNLYRINANGTGITNMTDAEEATVSPDGSTILYSQFQSGAGSSDLFTIPLAGGTATRLTNTSADERNPQWSKDGTFVVFSTDLDGNYNIYRMASTGGTQTQITNSGLDEYGPSLNQAGTMLSFSIIDPVNGVDDQGLYRCDISGLNRLTLKLGNIQTYTYWAPGSSGAWLRSPGGFGFFGMGGTHRPPIGGRNRYRH